MAILVDEKSRILIQGITGNFGRTFAAVMRAGGTPLVAGVSPGKGGTTVEEVPVYDDVALAVARHRADVALIPVPAPLMRDAAFEALAAGIRLMVLYAERVPVHDAAEIIALARLKGVTVFGPNSAGLASPGRANVSDLHDRILRPGPVGVVSKSGTLTYEVIDGLVRHGLGVSTVVCLGGDPIVGTGYPEVLQRFEADPETRAIVLIGEIGGQAELRAAECIRDRIRKPVFGYIAGQSAPPGKRMGHAGALVSGGNDSAAAKIEALKAAGVTMGRLPQDLPPLVAAALR